MARVTVTRSTLLAWGTVLLLALGASGLALAPAASAAGAPVSGSSLQELAETPEASTATTSTTSSTSSTESSTTNDQKTILIAIVAAVILLSGIAYVIARDARRVAPATDADLAEGRSAKDPAVTLRKRRAKAKAARQQRKRNR